MAKAKTTAAGKAFLALDDKVKEKKAKKKVKKVTAKEKVEKQKVVVPYAESRGVIYLSHLPHGLFEKQLRRFLSQFGSVTNLRLGRSRVTGRSKGYAFVEFRHREVADIVSQTMNNYLMFDKLLKCELVPVDKADRRVFRNKLKNPAKPPALEARRRAKREVNQLRTEEQNQKRLKRQLGRLTALKKKLEAAGITAELPEKPSKTGASPVMQVDEDDEDVRLKTPPATRKVRSAANSAAATPTAGGKKRGPVSAALLNQLLGTDASAPSSAPSTAKKSQKKAFAGASKSAANTPEIGKRLSKKRKSAGKS